MEFVSYKRKFAEKLKITHSQADGMVHIVAAIARAFRTAFGIDAGPSIGLAAEMLTGADDSVVSTLAKSMVDQILLVKSTGNPPQFAIGIKLAIGLALPAIPIKLAPGEEPLLEKMAYATDGGVAFLLYPQTLSCGNISHAGETCQYCGGTGVIHSVYSGLDIIKSMQGFIKEHGLPEGMQKPTMPV